jgi:predicted sugar kinase
VAGLSSQGPTIYYCLKAIITKAKQKEQQQHTKTEKGPS